MTLKSLNTRYVKLIRKLAVMGVLLMATVSLLSPRWSAGATGFNRRDVEADNSIPSLQGAAAITYLKEHKLYDSLREALHAARSQRGDNSVFTPLFIDEQKLTASDGAPIDFFGTSVAVSGSTIVVGAPFDSIGGSSFLGSAYVFNRQGGSWVETQRLTASDGAPGDLFGFSVAVSGSTIVVGAEADDIGGNFEQGSAYIFNRHRGDWVETQKLTASDGAARDQFGSSVAVSGSTIVVGALLKTVGDTQAQGSAYVFDRQGGSWIQTQKLIASDGGVFDLFGQSVALSGSTVVVGAPFGDSFNRGSAYVFNRQGRNWVETQKLTASDETGTDLFGWTVAVTRSTVFVGAPFGGNVNEGSAHVFNHQGGSWIETQRLSASDGEMDDEFGASVAVSGSTVVVGAPLGGNFNQGATYVFGP